MLFLQGAQYTLFSQLAIFWGERLERTYLQADLLHVDSFVMSQQPVFLGPTG